MPTRANVGRRAVWVPDAVHDRIARLAQAKSEREDGRMVSHGEIIADGMRLLERQLEEAASDA